MKNILFIKMNFGMVHIYTGDGKGKTTAAVGLCYRCAGQGGKVLMTSFLKDFDSGEYITKKPSFDIFVKNAFSGFFNELSEEEKEAASKNAEEQLGEVFHKAVFEDYDLLVLDEVLFAASVGCIDINYLKKIILSKPKKLELVLTGRNCPEQLFDLADYISVINCVKHPYEKGCGSRIGIEK